MAIFGIGAYYNEDVSTQFVSADIVGIGWNRQEAPDLHQFLRSLKVGDIIYIKAHPPGSGLIIKAIGVIVTEDVLSEIETSNLASCARKVRWISKEPFSVPIPQQKNNVRSNTLYEEFHPIIQQEILRRMFS